LISAAQKNAQRNRNTIFVEDGELLRVDEFPGDQFVMRIRSPKCAAAAEPGSFVHVTCDDALPMRRPLSIMRVEDDCIDILFKIVGDGLRRLANRQTGDSISVLGPIGQAFRPSRERPNTLLIGGGVGIPPMVFLADFLRQQGGDWAPLAILGSELPFPFETMSSNIPSPWVDDAINATMPLMEDWGIPCRLATLAGFDGCFDGYVTDLADCWLSTLTADERQKTEVFSCGPTPMLKAVATLAAKYDLPCQVSLEEFMACAVGGCAGCAVKIKTPKGDAMKRVCVDGPVFEAASIIW
jgi:dihydroorotate dehydrogenase electron transfer subunit